MFFLVVQSGKHAGRRVKLPMGDVIVGRDEDSRIRIASTEVGRQHCRLIVSPEGIHVIDLDSRNGTYVDGIPISAEAVLEPGSRLTVGPMTFRLEGEGGAVAATRKTMPREAEDWTKQGLSDDDIAAMLSDEYGAVGASDTTVHGEDSAVITAVPDPVPAPVQRPKREFRSVAEEAQEIIRLYRESLEQPSDEARG